MATRMLQRRGTEAEWAAQNPVLSDGEIGYARDLNIIKIGDGITPWNDLKSPSFTIEELLNVVVEDPEINDILAFDGTTWVNIPIPEPTPEGDIIALIVALGG